MADIERLNLSIQKGGRMGPESYRLLNAAGLRFPQSNGNDLLSTPVDRFPMRIWFDRDDDIPLNVEAGISQFGIVGQNVVRESRASVIEVLRLGFARCRLVIAASPSAIPDLESLTGRIQVVTSYANEVNDWAGKNKVPVEIVERMGSIEGYTERGYRVIADLTATGKALADNGLRILSVISKSEAVLIADPKLKNLRGSEEITRSLIRRILSVKRAEGKTYVASNAPASSLEAIASVMHGETSPTVSDLDQQDWKAISAVVPIDQLDKMVDEIQNLGARKTIDLGMRRIFPDPDDPEVLEALARIYN